MCVEGLGQVLVCVGVERPAHVPDLVVKNGNLLQVLRFHLQLLNGAPFLAFHLLFCGGRRILGSFFFRLFGAVLDVVLEAVLNAVLEVFPEVFLEVVFDVRMQFWALLVIDFFVFVLVLVRQFLTLHFCFV